MKKCSITLLLAGLLLGLAARPARAQGTLIVQHSGYNNPTNEGFVASFSSADPVQVGPVTNDLGMDAWSTTSSAYAGHYDDFFSSVAGLDWELTGILRVATPGTEDVVFPLEILTGTEYFGLLFGSQANGDPTFQVDGSSLSPILVLNGAGSSYNTYQLIYNAQSDTASLWVNGVEQLGDIYGYPNQGGAGLDWGIGDQGLFPGTANWNLVSLEIVPEPSIMTLLGVIGLPAILLFRRKHISSIFQTKNVGIESARKF